VSISIPIPLLSSASSPDRNLADSPASATAIGAPARNETPGPHSSSPIDRAQDDDHEPRAQCRERGQRQSVVTVRFRCRRSQLPHGLWVWLR
jgi:hypothetical protein